MQAILYHWSLVMFFYQWRYSMQIVLYHWLKLILITLKQITEWSQLLYNHQNMYNNLNKWPRIYSIYFIVVLLYYKRNYMHNGIRTAVKNLLQKRDSEVWKFSYSLDTSIAWFLLGNLKTIRNHRYSYLCRLCKEQL